MSRKWIGGLACLLAALGLAALFLVTASGSQAPQDETEIQSGAGQATPPQRERQSNPDAPAISFIDNPSPTCYHPAEKASDACYIEWSYMQVSASTSAYVISMTVSIDGRLRAYYSGFFQTYFYVPSDMHYPGFKVSCGPPGSNPNPALGKSYSFIVRARETGGLSAANYGSVTCPAGPRKIFLPQTLKQ